MRYLASAFVVIAVFHHCPAFAQKGTCTEQFIRAAAESGTTQPTTADSYLFNPILEKPVIGHEEVDKAFKAIRANTALMENRKNFKGDLPNLDRVVVAPSGDMAYAYGTRHISYDESDGKHVDAIHAFLQVWRVDGGSCKLAADMVQREGQR